jgi:hypothetical protein
VAPSLVVGVNGAPNSGFKIQIFAYIVLHCIMKKLHLMSDFVLLIGKFMSMQTILFLFASL